jgi:hypothetical protein
MKVAQYEVLGKRSLKASVPEETIDECWQSLRRMRDSKLNVSIVPRGTDMSLCFISQHFVLGFYEADVVKPHRKKGCLNVFS